MNMNKPTPEDNNVFTTYDLGLSAAILASGYKLKNLDRTNRRALFVFEHKSGIDVTANKFLADELRVKARSYFDSLKALKSKLYSV